jgi:hypothetical protein
MRMRPLLCTVGHVSLSQLLANACIAAWRVASYPCVGVRSLWSP